MSTSAPDRLNAFPWGRWSLLAGCVALVICVAGALLGAPQQFFRAYLAAYVFVLGTALGGMAILMLYHLTGGAWGFLIRRVLEAQMRTLPLVALLFIPIGLGLETLYLWAQPELVQNDERLQGQQFYLNTQFFLGRTVIYFCIWLFFAFLLTLKSRRQEREGDERIPTQFERLGEIGLVLFGTTMHFAAFDWLETLQPNFHSTIFPMLVVSGQLLSAQAFAVIVFIAFVLPREAAGVTSRRALNDLGNILLAFLIIWAYMNFFQFMLIWIANMSSDVLWYAPRSRGVWRPLVFCLVFASFVIPFFLLLMRSIKQHPQSLAKVAALILFSQLLFNYYLVMPVFQAPSLLEHWMDFLTPIGVGGVWFALFVNRLRSRSLLPAQDPNQEKAEHLRALDDEDFEREHIVVRSGT
ncbi:MAG TPA: hypothetical protein VG055_05015 [Planctomycetaceae bacterium]|jgi:hypothetical protein|nr:hypothetical protein [Planctomycetaceae bacterium]